MEVKDFNRKEKKEFITAKIINCIIPSNQYICNYNYNWAVGTIPDPVHIVCKNTFMLCYEVGHTYIQVIQFVALIVFNLIIPFVLTGHSY